MSQNLLISRVFPSLVQTPSHLRTFIIAFMGSLLLAASAKFQIPLYPVKISMQPFCVFFLGCMLGSRVGLASVALYLLEGALGFPVFQGTPDRGIGLAYMVGPTGGYLVGFAVSIFVVGFLAEKGLGKSVRSSLILFVIGALVNDVFGVSWLTALFNFETAKAVWVSYQIPFLLNTALGAVLVPALWSVLEHKKKQD